MALRKRSHSPKYIVTRKTDSFARLICGDRGPRAYLPLQNGSMVDTGEPGVLGLHGGPNTDDLELRSSATISKTHIENLIPREYKAMQ